MLLNGPACPDILDILVDVVIVLELAERSRRPILVVVVIVLELAESSRWPSVHIVQSKSGLSSGPFLVFLMGLMQS